MPEILPKIRVVPDPQALAVAAVEQTIIHAREAIADHDAFHVALSGGSTPKAMFELLASDRYCRDVDWKKWEIYFGDERCVPPTDPESNFHTASLALLDRVPIRPDRIYRMKGEIDPAAAAAEYSRMLQEKFPDTGLDLVMLGMGDDGHTASLFPGTPALDATGYCVANFVPKFNTWRITLTAPFINRAHRVMVLVAGAAKAGRIDEVLQGEHDPKRLPIQLIQPADGELLWLMDAAAAGMNEE